VSIGRPPEDDREDVAIYEEHLVLWTLRLVNRVVLGEHFRAERTFEGGGVRRYFHPLQAGALPQPEFGRGRLGRGERP